MNVNLPGDILHYGRADAADDIGRAAPKASTAAPKNTQFRRGVDAIAPACSHSHGVGLARRLRKYKPMQFAEDPEIQAWVRVWAWILLACCSAAAALVLLALWVLDDFHGLGLDANTTIALLLGAVVTSGLCVVLMGLLFYSNASRTDEDVRDFSADPHRHGERSDTGAQREPDRGP